MPDFRRRPTPALAFPYSGQPQAEWPAWVKSYEVYNAGLGAQRVSEQLGVLVIPTINNSIRVSAGMVVVREGFEGEGDAVTGGTITAYTADQFADQFEAVEPDAA